MIEIKAHNIGSQYIANNDMRFLISAEAKQEFTHIATPQEYSYIESYHGILQSELVERFELNSYYEAKLTIGKYVEFYNNKKIHGSLKMQTPQKIWDAWNLNQMNKEPLNIDNTEALSTNGERKDLKIGESQLV